MDTLMRPVSGVMNFIYKLFRIYSQIVLLVIVILVSVQVLLRQLGKIWHDIKVIPWGDEVSLFLMVWMAFIALCIGVEMDLHISVTLLYNHFPKPVQTFFKYFNLLLTLIVGLFLLVYGVKLVGSTMASTLPATKWPKGLMYCMIPASGFFTMYFCLLRLLRLDRYLPDNREKALQATNEGGETDAL